MRPPIDGATALITGASSGIGRELARELAPRVRALALVARRKERLEELAKELKAKRPDLIVHVEAADVTNREVVDALPAAIEKAIGPVDLLINNAGLGDFALFDQASWPKTQQLIDVNVTSLARLTHLFLPGMVARKRGGILNVSSGFGLQFMPGFAAYVGTKHFVTGFTESLRCDVASEGVCVSQLCPGPVATEFEEITAGAQPLRTPGFMNMSAEKCARIAIRKFARGRALIIPGFMVNVVYALGGIAPRWLLRFIYARAAKRYRIAFATK
jgi:short-subunit dehydrogenase